MVGRFYTWALARMNPNDTDAFRSSLVQRGRIPLVAHTTVRMMSPPIEGGNGSNPGPGNNGNPVDPGQPTPRRAVADVPVVGPELRQLSGWPQLAGLPTGDVRAGHLNFDGGMYVVVIKP